MQLLPLTRQDPTMLQLYRWEWFGLRCLHHSQSQMCNHRYQHLRMGMLNSPCREHPSCSTRDPNSQLYRVRHLPKAYWTLDIWLWTFDLYPSMQMQLSTWYRCIWLHLEPRNYNLGSNRLWRSLVPFPLKECLCKLTNQSTHLLQIHLTEQRLGKMPKLEEINIS